MITRRSLLASASAPLALGQQRKRPNILLVTADDLGLQLGCYGEKLITTPNLDKFAAGGVRFRTAYVVQASCSPSRSGMFTGLFPHANGQYGLANTGHKLHDHLHNATIPAVLKDSGYRTGIIGKLHVEPEASFPFDLRETNSGPTRQVRDVAKRADEFFRAESRDPFFLMVNFSDPHAFRKDGTQNEWYFPSQVDGLPENPLQPSAATIFPFQGIDTEEQRERTANYYNAIRRLDHGVGLLMDNLAKSGNQENTLVVFCGDHGPPFARGKTTCYDSGLRVPFLVSWPGVTKPGMREAFVSTVDIAPTIYDAARVKPPMPLHGRSLRPVLERPDASWRRYLGAEFHMHGARPFYPRRAIRDTRFKLIHNLLAGTSKPSTGIDGDQAFQFSRDAKYNRTPLRRAFDTFANPPQFEFYDLSKDPHEWDNLAGQPAVAEDQKRLTEALLSWRKGTADPFLDSAFAARFTK